MAYRHAVRRTVVLTGLAAAALSFNGLGVGAQGGTVTLGSYHSDDVPKRALQAMADYCTAQTGVAVTITTTNHNDFQDAITSYLQATPDDIFTWFAGYRMQFFADQGLMTNIDDVWAEITPNYSEAFKVASTGLDGSQYMIPILNYPWVVMYRQSVFAEKGYTVPTNWTEFIALMEKMRADGLIPLAFADGDGWPAMGTFDILNMRLNGYQFHVDLMAGREMWTDPRVATVFETWKQLLPHYSDGALGATWQEGAQQMVNGQAGMYFLGTFAGQQATDPAVYDDLDFFAFPTLGTEFDAELGIDAPIDGYSLSKAPANLEGAKAILKCFSTGAAQNVYMAIDTNNVAAANDTDTSVYNPKQVKMAELIGASGAIAQFLDRDTVPAFAGPNGMQGLLQNWLADPEQDLPAYQQTIQDAWDTLSVQ